MLFQDFETTIRQICLIAEPDRVPGIWGDFAAEFIPGLDQFCRRKTVVLGWVYMAHFWPMETILFPICLGHGKMIEEILGKLK
jgi:hypothetical protein